MSMWGSKAQLLARVQLHVIMGLFFERSTDERVYSLMDRAMRMQVGHSMVRLKGKL